MSFQAFVYEKLYMAMLAKPVLTEEEQAVDQKLNSWKPAWLLDEDFRIRAIPKTIVDPETTIDNWVREYYGPLTTRIQMQSLHFYLMYQRPQEEGEIRYTVNISYSRDSSCLIVTVESFAEDVR